MINWESEQGRKIVQQLHQELVIWFTTVSQDGTPMPTPVWFLWEGETFLIYTIKDSKKVLNLQHQPQASLNLNTDLYGDRVLVVTGEAHIAEDEFPALQNPEYLKKYREQIAVLGMTPETFSTEYSVPIRFRPKRWRA